MMPAGNTQDDSDDEDGEEDDDVSTWSILYFISRIKWLEVNGGLH
jgi:hypothetical protein